MKISVQKFSKTVNPFSGISFVKSTFDQAGTSQLFENEIFERCSCLASNIAILYRNLTNVFLRGANCIEDIAGNLENHLKNISNNNVPNPDWIIRSKLPPNRVIKPANSLEQKSMSFGRCYYLSSQKWLLSMSSNEKTYSLQIPFQNRDDLLIQQLGIVRSFFSCSC